MANADAHLVGFVRISDAAGIQFRVLNRSKGPAVWVRCRPEPATKPDRPTLSAGWRPPFVQAATAQGPRVQVDRKIYKQAMQTLLASYPNLELREASVQDVRLAADAGNKPQVTGVVLEDGTVLQTPAAVVTTGTFLRGEIHLGTRAPNTLFAVG